MWFDIKNQIWNFKKIPQFFFQKMPNIPELPKNAKMRLFSLIFKHCVDQVFQTKTLFFVKSFATVESSNPWFSAICLHFCQLFVYFFVYIVSWLFTFLIFKKNIEKSWLFCQKFEFKFLIFSCLFTFFVYIVSCLFTFIKIWILAPKLSFSETFCHYDSLSPKLWNWKFLWVLSFLNFHFFFVPKLSFSETFCHYASLSPKVWNLKIFLDF